VCAGASRDAALMLVELGLLVLTSPHCKCCVEGRTGRARIPALGAGEGTFSLSLPTEARQRQSMISGRRQQAGSARKTPRGGDRVSWAER
jgi:hypothetical protein